MYSCVDTARKEALRKEILDHYGHSCSHCGSCAMGLCEVESDIYKIPRQRHVRSPFKVESHNYSFYKRLKAAKFPKGFVTMCPNHLWEMIKFGKYMS